tara:strand:+ start:1440 stop:1805 length:366 start_codon:yes stop_codon:yes gene_type:complete
LIRKDGRHRLDKLSEVAKYSETHSREDLKKEAREKQFHPLWPTPTVQEAGKISNRPNYGQKALSNHPEIQGKCTRPKLNKSRDGLPDLDRSSTIGKSRGQLNPAWVEALMGLPPGWTDFDF